MYKTSGTTNRTLPFIVNELRKNEYDISVVYDIGANDGRWWKQYRPLFNNCECIQFEANPNMQPSIPGRGAAYYSAVLSDEDAKTVKFYTGGNSPTGHSYYKELTPAYKNSGYIELQTITLDSMVRCHNLKTPDFMKMDTQGSEVDILRGAEETLKDCLGIICEVPVMYYNEGAPNFGEYVAEMLRHGFVASGVHNILIRNGVFNQMDVIFLKQDVLSKLHNNKNRYIGL